MNVTQKAGLENLGAIEHWSVMGDAVHMVLPDAVRCVCRELHHWYVNRDGKTRCVRCDELYVRQRNADLRRSCGLPAAEMSAA